MDFIHQRHHGFGDAMVQKELIRGGEDHIDNCIANADDVEFRIHIILGWEMAAAFIEKIIGEVTTGKRVAVLSCALTLLTAAAAAQPISAEPQAETEMHVAPSSAVAQPSETPAPPAPDTQMPSPAPETAMPAPIPTDGSAIRARFGAPDFLRREMDNELWRYDANHCSVFFFLQRRGATLQLRYTETLPRGTDIAADPACVTALDQRTARMPGDVTGSSGAQP
jgi:hypothetical protein